MATVSARADGLKQRFGGKSSAACAKDGDQKDDRGRHIASISYPFAAFEHQTVFVAAYNVCDAPEATKTDRT
jgi:hypothetical protein